MNKKNESNKKCEHVVNFLCLLIKEAYREKINYIVLFDILG